MTVLQLVKARIQAGVWEGLLNIQGGSSEAPALEVTHLSRTLEGVLVEPSPERAGSFVIKVPIPADILTDGVQTCVISDAASGETLETFSIVTGEPLDDDIRAEVNLLRAELDMLKRAFRRHCMETS